MWSWFKRWMGRFWRKEVPHRVPFYEPEHVLVSPIVEEVAAAPAAAAVAEPPKLLSRHQRRVMASRYRELEKARMKFDKFVTPQGPEIPKKSRKPKEEKIEAPAAALPAEQPEEAAVGDDMKEIVSGNICVVEHYDDDPNNPEVLYEESEFWGQFTFRDTILDQLDSFFFYIDRMKKRDANAYHHYRQTGVQLVPYMRQSLFGKPDKISAIEGEELKRYKKEIVLPPMFRQMRPSFGCIAYGANPKVEKWEEQNKKCVWPRFMYYTKFDMPPPEIQMISGGDIYKMTVWWDRRDRRRKHGSQTDFAVFVSADGNTIKLLKTCELRWVDIKEKRGLGHFHIPDRSWRFPDDFVEWAGQFKLDPETFLTHTFAMAINDMEFAQYGDVRVQVSKDDVSAVFNVDSRRMSYFFKDRDIELNENGSRERIFHIVKAFVDKNGVAHRMQYRGAKHFKWAGYDVDVTVPGLDHFMLDEMNIGAIDSRFREKGKKYATEPEVGARIAEMIKDHVGGHPPH